MAYPTKYTRQFDFQSYQNANPTRPLPGDKVNADLNLAEMSVGEVVEFLKVSLRSDGALANESVGDDQLTAAVRAKVNAVGGDYDALVSAQAAAEAAQAAAEAAQAGAESAAVSIGLPPSNDGAALGSTSLKWSDLFLAAGAVVNFNSGDVTLTHSSNTLAFAGGTAYRFDADMFVSTNGSDTTTPRTFGFSDLSSGEAARVQFGDALTALQSRHGGRMQLTAYHGIEFYGARASGTGLAFVAGSNVNDPNVHIVGTHATSRLLRITAAASQSVNILECRDSTPTVLMALGSAGGLVLGNPTGGNKGDGTLNATAVYDDNSLLTCPALQREFIESGTVDLDKWDALVPPVIVPAHVRRTPVMETVVTVVKDMEREKDGSLVVREREIAEQRQVTSLTPVFDDRGNGLNAVDEPVFDEEEIPEQVIRRPHRTAHLFAAMLAEGFDPRNPVAYIDRLKADAALPGMPTEAEWTAHGPLSTGELQSRMWLAIEFLALAFIGIEKRVSVLEGNRV